MATLTSLIQGKSFEETKKLVRGSPYFLTLRDNDKDHPELFLLASTEKSPGTDSVVQESNGIILVKGTNKLVCYGVDRTLDPVDCQVSDFEAPEANYTTEECLDGTMIKLYFYKEAPTPIETPEDSEETPTPTETVESEGQWYTSTTRTINAKNSTWGLDTSFDDLFHKLLPELDYSKLDRNLTYSFVLCGSSNRHVVEYTDNKLYLIGVRNINTLEEVNIRDGSLSHLTSQCSVPSPREVTPASYSQVTTETDDVPLNLFERLAQSGNGQSRGVIVTLMTAENRPLCRVKVDFPTFLQHQDLRGNTESLKSRYLELLSQPEQLKALRALYPDQESEFNAVDTIVSDTAKDIQNQYFQRYVKRIPDFKINENYTQTVRQLHAKYRKDGQKTTVKSVLEHISSLPPKAVARVITL